MNATGQSCLGREGWPGTPAPAAARETRAPPPKTGARPKSRANSWSNLSSRP